MFYAQVSIPFLLVVVCFIAGHILFPSSGSGVYLPDFMLSHELEHRLLSEELPDEILIDQETGKILPDKYNYLKIENVFTGQLIEAGSLFSIEIALLTKQPSVASDLFIAKLLEIEPDLVAEITKSLLNISAEDLLSESGRLEVTKKIMVDVNNYLEVKQNMKPAITDVFITNVNVL